ncbi:MAG: rod shape-determining protein RodA [Candidatus Saccharibacteria bacterium]
MLSRRTIKVIDKTFVLAVLGLLIFGLIILASASRASTSDALFYVKKQLIWVVVGIAMAVGMLNFDSTHLHRYSKLFYVATLGILALTLIFGREVNGSQGWIRIAGINFQMAELAKVLIILGFADFLNKRQGQLDTFVEMIPCFIYIGVPILLILAQPDLGTALVFIAIMFGMMFMAGANHRILLVLLISGILFIVGVLYLHVAHGLPLPLKEYQIQRLTVFVDPYSDGQGGRGAGWNTIQALVAVGSGGLTGKGLFHGTQAQLSFLPEQHTDFIFAVIGEELGFAGAAVLLILYAAIIWRSIFISYNAKDFYSTLVGIGLISMWMFHIFENIGMSVGIMPITGIPLPFISYGGSSMLTNMIGVGLLLDINLKGKKIVF